MQSPAPSRIAFRGRAELCPGRFGKLEGMGFVWNLILVLCCSSFLISPFPLVPDWHRHSPTIFGDLCRDSRSLSQGLKPYSSHDYMYWRVLPLFRSKRSKIQVPVLPKYPISKTCAPVLSLGFLTTSVFALLYPQAFREEPFEQG